MIDLDSIESFPNGNIAPQESEINLNTAVSFRSTRYVINHNIFNNRTNQTLRKETLRRYNTQRIDKASDFLVQFSRRDFGLQFELHFPLGL